MKLYCSRLSVNLLLPLVALGAMYPAHINHKTVHSVSKPAAKKPVTFPWPITSAYEWTGYGGNMNHQALSPIGAQDITHVLWSTPVDAHNYNGNEILVHYGEAAVTATNTVVLGLRPEPGGSYLIHGLKGKDGTEIWNYTSTYIDPNHDWGPSFGAVLLPTTVINVVTKGVKTPIYVSPQVAWPESGGRVAIRQNADKATGEVRLWAFYGNSTYAANSAAYDANVKICTPLTVGIDGSIYFGVVVEGNVPNKQVSGIGVIRPDGSGGFIPAASLSGDNAAYLIPLNCAPALSPDGKTVYVETATSAAGWGRGYICSFDTVTLTPQHHAPLMDVANPGNWATTLGDSTASPMVGPDGDVFIGVLENPFLSNDDRGWMLHFSSDLLTQKTPGAFGWDDTASIVPASIVTSYHGNSQYLICTKYNDYADFGTQPGLNKVAILDPNATGTDSVSGQTTMKEILTLLGPTANHGLAGVREWCVNSVTIDPTNKVAILNSEDGYAYKWDLTTGNVLQKMQLSPGIGEAYTPTIIGPNGVVYCVNNAIFYALGTKP